MTALDDLPAMSSFLGIVDLKTGCYIIAAIGMIHPIGYGCSFFIPMSYLLLTIWFLVGIYFIASVMLFAGVVYSDEKIIAAWVWYALVFHVAMMMLMIMLIIVFAFKKKRNRICVVLLGIVWYILTVYFILVVNSYRKMLTYNSEVQDKVNDKVDATATTTTTAPWEFPMTTTSTTSTTSSSPFSPTEPKEPADPPESMSRRWNW